VPEDMVICSLCLRVHRGSEWVAAERVIRETRSYESDTMPRFHGSICDDCADRILRQRSRAEQQLAA
jgi:hypothetical protein